MYLLDTNILSDLARNPQGRVARKIGEIGEPQIYTSIIVASELKFGAEKSGSESLNERISRILAAMRVEDFKHPAEMHYARIRSALEQSGQPIGGNDLLIAAHALADDAAIVTANEREFSRVPGLVVVNWLV